MELARLSQSPFCAFQCSPYFYEGSYNAILLKIIVFPGWEIFYSSEFQFYDGHWYISLSAYDGSCLMGKTWPDIVPSSFIALVHELQDEWLSESFLPFLQTHQFIFPGFYLVFLKISYFYHLLIFCWGASTRSVHKISFIFLYLEIFPYYCEVADPQLCTYFPLWLGFHMEKYASLTLKLNYYFKIL